MDEILEIPSQPTLIILQRSEFQAITIPDHPITTTDQRRFAIRDENSVLYFCRFVLCCLAAFGGFVWDNLVSAFVFLNELLARFNAKSWVTSSSSIREFFPFLVSVIIRFWNRIFIISCVCAVSTAPLFLYVPVINQHIKCFTFDQRLKKIATAFGMLTTTIYGLDAILQFYSLRRYFAPELWAGFFEEKIRWLYILIDLSAVFPQLGYFMIFTPNYPRWMFLNFLFMYQYVLQVIRIYQLAKELGQETPTREISTVKGVFKLWVKVAFIFYIFILTSHVFGAIWYSLSFQREIDCWQDACGENRCEHSTLYCGYHATSNDFSLLNDLCPIHSPNTTLFDFGIFLDSLQSGTLESKNFPQNFLHCFWWGLRNLSSFGQSLQTSTYAWENLFAVFICITGMLLVLIWLNAILQTYMQLGEKRSKENRKLMEMTNKRNPEIATWLEENGLPMHLKEKIMTHVVRELKPHEDVSILTIHSILRLKDVRDIKRYLCLDILKKVPMLQTIAEEKQLDAICEYLKPMIFHQDSFIIEAGQLLYKMIFITQGAACIYRRGFDGSSSSSSSNVGMNIYLKKGDFHGSELLSFRTSNDVKDLPTSFTSVKCITKVEAYVLWFTDLESIREILAGNL